MKFSADDILILREIVNWYRRNKDFFRGQTKLNRENSVSRCIQKFELTQDGEWDRSNDMEWSHPAKPIRRIGDLWKTSDSESAMEEKVWCLPQLPGSSDVPHGWLICEWDRQASRWIVISSPKITIQFPEDGIPAADGYKPGKAECKVLVFDADEYRDTGRTREIRNWSASAIGAEGLRLGMADFKKGIWQVAAADCEDERAFVAAEVI